MKNTINLILKGMLIGLGKVLPGVSGSLIAVSLGIYEKAIDSISNLFNNLKENLLFLGMIGLGVIFSIAFGSKAVIYLLEFCYVPTMLLFIGFIAGIFPNLYYKIEIKDKKLIYFFLIAIFLVLSIKFISSNATFYPQNNLYSYFIIMGIGFLDATTMVIPGISGTAIFMMLGCYNFVLNLFASLSNLYELFSNFLYYFFFGIGLLVGIIIVSKIMSYLFYKYREITYTFIMGFTLSSIFVLLGKVLTTYSSIVELLIGIILAGVGYMISKHFGKE